MEETGTVVIYSILSFVTYKKVLVWSAYRFPILGIEIRY